MNIAIFTNNYLPNPYGVSTSIETFRREFEALGHTVYIFAPHFPGYSDKNPRVFRYPALDIEFKIRFPLAIPYSWKMRRILKKLDIDIIHSQHPNLLGTAAARWAKKKKVPLIFTWHTLYECYAHFAYIIPKKLAVGYMAKKAVRYADKANAVVVPTDSIIPILKKWGVKNKNIFPIATGIVKKEFKNPDDRKIRKKYRIGDDEIVLILITRLSMEKNIGFLFEAVKDFLKKTPRARFILGGDGDLLGRIKKTVVQEGLSNQVILPGIIARKDIKNYLAAGDILVDASKSETQGMHVSEAMYMKLPVVAVSATGVSSLVINNGNGFLVPEDKKFFVEAVEKLAVDENLRQKFGEASRRIIETQFLSDVCAKKMLELYSKCIAGNPKK